MKAKQDLFNYDGNINTISKIKLSLFDPKPEMIDIYDIACGLSYKSHFAGQTPYYFSIAQHCLLVVNLLDADKKENLLLPGLLHDAAEAYINDMIKPLKIHFPKFVEIENNLLKVIFQKFDLDFSDLDLIKEYDKRAQIIEFENFYEGSSTLFPLSPEQSKMAFLRLFNELINK